MRATREDNDELIRILIEQTLKRMKGDSIMGLLAVWEQEDKKFLEEALHAIETDSPFQRPK